MTRGLISETEVPFVSPSPVRQNVPGMFLDDELYLSLCAALDDLIAPDAVALDCLPAYLDPQLSPEDFLPWLGALVGAPADRAGIATAVTSYGLRGTPLGLRTIAAAAAGVPLDAVRLSDPGGVRWSSTAGSAWAAPGAVAVLRDRRTRQ